MQDYFERRPLRLYFALVLSLLVFGAAARPAVGFFLPDLSMMGLRVTVNWLFVILVVGLVALLGWWDEIRLTAPLAAGGRRYLLVLAALVALPMLVTVLAVPDPFAVPLWTFVEGQELSAVAVALMVVVGIALGAAISEELLYRGVVLRSLESYGRWQAAVASSVLFGIAHLSLLALGAPLAEVLVIAGLSMVVFFGLAAVTFRIGTLWPLIVWHFLQDSRPAFLTARALEVYIASNVVLAVGLAVLGAWLLWSDAKAELGSGSVGRQVGPV